jgi:triosephosphate isomerase
MRRSLVAGNWKMNTTRSAALELALAVAEGAHSALKAVDVAIAPPFPYLLSVGEAIRGSGVALAAQNAWHEKPGAFTGEVALDMLLDCGCKAVILGHSERRHILGETDALINQKVRATLAKGLQAILCVGELLAERDAEKTTDVLDRQMSGGLRDVEVSGMDRVVVAYEPVWAIGTGRTATPDQAESAHAHLRKWLAARYNPHVAEATRILYGGSVKADNALDLLGQRNVDGALVGGASLKAEQFLPIVQAAVDAART